MTKRTVDLRLGMAGPVVRTTGSVVLVALSWGWLRDSADDLP
jgi:hypothetical protein